MQFPPSTWGPIFWHTIHITALGYPTAPTYADKKAAKEFYESFVQLVPCPVCRNHYREHLINFPITPSLDTRDDLLRWTVDLHNTVNKMLGKSGEYTVTDVIAFYKKLGGLGRSPMWTPEDFHTIQLQSIGVGATIALIAVGVVGFFIWRKSAKDSGI